MPEMAPHHPQIVRHPSHLKEATMAIEHREPYRDRTLLAPP